MTSADADLLNFSAHARVLLSLTAIAWIAHAFNFGNWLNRLFALRPRNLWGLVGIPLSPFLHANMKHLTGNTSAFLPLAWFILLQGIHVFYVVTIGIVLGSGILTWLLGREKGEYIGASDVVYGYQGFLLIYGIIAHSWIALLLAIVSTYLYGRALTGYTIQSKGRKYIASSGILPNSDVPNMAWESHLFGFVVGGLLAYLLGMMKLNYY